MLKAWLFFGFSTVIACSADPLQPGQTPAKADSSVMPDAFASDAGPLCGRPVSALCSQNPTGPIALNSLPDVLAAMTGRWVLCGDESVFAADGGEVGLEITADNHWYKLFPSQGAATIRGAGFDEEGTWTSLDLGDHFQVNFDIFGSGTVTTAPVFASTPRAMRLNNNGVFVGNYVIDPTVPTGSVRCAPEPDPTRSGD
jgi:hypothetical protein